MVRLLRLLTIPKQNRDVAWLQDALQEAVEIEFSTIPPYLYAMWSIKNPAETACQDILAIVLEEMLHMGTACNLLAGLGGSPKTTGTAVPTFPGKLKAGVHADLTVGLEPLSKALLLNAFMRIEEPEINLADTPDFAPSGTKLIGTFYRAIQDAFNDAKPPLDLTKQIDLTTVGLSEKATAGTWQDAIAVIDIIIDQGEGTASSPFDNGELAHFYRFAQLYEGKKLATSPSADTGKYEFSGDSINFPELWPNVPTNPPQSAFDDKYSEMLRNLESAWNGHPEKLAEAVFTDMDGLSPIAVTMMQAATGPAFIYVP